ncbi:3-oxoacid CoA-transferase subunit B [Lacihabitans sp. CCS-44]|nr:3-oxoacid CoA-transferase subunit B [Lacihabitans sp. CCS-44]
MISKVVKNSEEAIADIGDGSILMLGGFGLCGIPENCIQSLVEKGVKNLTCISNNAGVDDFGIGLMLQNRQVKKMISSYVGENKEFERQLLSGELEVELIPQGTLAERIRAGGAGIPAFFTPAGVGTEVAQGKQVEEFDGKKYLKEAWLRADFSIIKAWKGDKSGNLVFKGTARNFSPMMAAAGKICIAEVEELVETGELNPNEIHVPGIYVQMIFQGENYQKRIEQRTTAPPAPDGGADIQSDKDNPKLLRNSSYWQKADPFTYGLLKEYSIKMRNNPTNAEKIMWEGLCGKKLDGFKFRRQHIIGQYITDFVCLKVGLIIEIDGLIHQLPENQSSDLERTNWLEGQGFKVIRFSNHEVFTQYESVLEKILQEIEKHKENISGIKNTIKVAPPSGAGGAVFFELGIGLTKFGIAKRISQEIKNNSYANLGIGIPTLVANYIPKEINVMLQSENGLLGIGPFPKEENVDADLINAGKQTVTMQAGSALFDSAESFAMIRGEHVDLTILGAMEVSENGDIANWKIPGKMVKGMGGAMDLVASAKNIIVAMQHVSKDGKSKLLEKCTLPITGLRCVKKIVTELCVIEVLPDGKGFNLLELAPGITKEQVQAATEGKLRIDSELKEMKL